MQQTGGALISVRRPQLICVFDGRSGARGRRRDKPAMSGITWQDPWFSIDAQSEDQDRLEKELERELPHGHILEGRHCHAIACRIDMDDVLFLLDGGPGVAVVHLTYGSNRESDPAWPHTEIFADSADFEARRLAQDVTEYMSGSR